MAEHRPDVVHDTMEHMLVYIFGSLLVAIGLGALALQRLYSSVPARELKRLAARGDALAQLMYRPAGYGPSLRLLLWLVLAFSWSGGLVLLIGVLSPVAGFALLLVLSVVAFVWLPTLRLTEWNARAATWFAPMLTWLLSHGHPLLSRITQLVYRRRQPIGAHSRLYETQDLLEFLELQADQVGNRIPAETLELAARAITFGHKAAGSLARPLQQTVAVNADDTVGPVLLDQLYQAGQSSFLVYKDSRDNIIGTLTLSDAVRAKQGGRMFDLVRGGLAFVHEDFSLPDVLAAFQKTGQKLLVVINSFEESIGIITLDDLLGELLGDTAEPKDLQYESRTAVAAYQPPDLAEAREAAQATPPAPPEPTSIE